MIAHHEMGGKTLIGRQCREWYVSMISNVQGRKCVLLRFRKRDTDRCLVRWLDTGKTRWVGRYEIEPELSV